MLYIPQARVFTSIEKGLSAARLTIFLLCFLIMFLSLWHASPAFTAGKPSIRVISPNGGEVWKEGETHRILWKAEGVKRVCITVGVGGKDKGLIGNDECKIDANRGMISWKIPRGFITGFGIKKADNVRVLIFDPDRPDVKDFSDGFFTITAADYPVEKEEKSSAVAPGDEYGLAVRSYFESLIKKDFKRAYDMLSQCRIILYNSDGSAVAFQPRENYELWLREKTQYKVLSIKNIKRVDSPKKASKGDALALLGIRSYMVVANVESPGTRPSTKIKKTLFVHVVKGSDGKIRILGIGTGP